MQLLMSTIKSCCLHTALALAAKSNLKTHKVDIKVAYPYEDKKKTLPAVPQDTSAC